MHLNNESSSPQLALHFSRAKGLPFAVSPRSLRLRTRRRLTRPSFNALVYSERVELLRILRCKYRAAVRSTGNAAAFASSPEGRRAHAVIDGMVMTLCG